MLIVITSVLGYANSMNQSLSHSSSPGVAVLGMHRSGTSLLTSLLEAAGFFVGAPDEVFPAQPCNEEGFWERRDVVALNECLIHFRARNDTPWPPMSGWLQNQIVTRQDLTPEQALSFDANAKKILKRLSGHGQPWVVKDPRLCLTFSCWADILKPNAVILMYRNPLEVAASLQKRDNLPTSFALAMWELHLQATLNASLGLPRLLLSMDALFSDPRTVMAGLLAFLQENGVTTALPAENIPYDSLIKPGLVHHKNPTEDGHSALSKPQHQLLQRLREGVLPDQPQTPSENCLKTLSEFRFWINRQMAAQTDLTRLTSKIRLMEEALGFHEGLAWHYASLAARCLETMEEHLAANCPSPSMPFLRGRQGGRTDHHTALERKLKEFRRNEKALAHSRVPAPPPPPRITIVLRVDDECWLSAALKTYGQAGCGALLVTSSTPGMAAALEEELKKSPLPSNLLCHFCECPPYEAPTLPTAVMEFLAPLKPDWILAPKANEFLSPPREYASLADWLLEMGNLSFRGAAFQEYVFLPCRESPEHSPQNFQETLRWYYPLGVEPRRDLAWRFLGADSPPNMEDIPEGLRREKAPHTLGILRTYLFLHPSRALALHGYPPDSPPPALPSVADLAFDDGHPEHLNPCPPRLTHLPLFAETSPHP